MKLEQLLEGVPYTLVQGSLELDIEDIIYDSRKAAPGRLFVCIVGTQRDSHDYAAQCAAEGVTALVIQHRHQGQDHHHPYDQERAGGRRPQGGHDRHQWHLLPRPSSGDGQHHPREL